jgi:hypothetical protein
MMYQWYQQFTTVRNRFLTCFWDALNHFCGKIFRHRPALGCRDTVRGV